MCTRDFRSRCWSAVRITARYGPGVGVILAKRGAGWRLLLRGRRRGLKVYRFQVEFANIGTPMRAHKGTSYDRTALRRTG